MSFITVPLAPLEASDVRSPSTWQSVAVPFSGPPPAIWALLRSPLPSMGGSTSRAFEATSRSRPASLKITAVVPGIFSHDCARIITDEVSKRFNSRVDIFVNNAGATGTGTTGEMSADHIQRSLFANVQTPIMIVEDFVRRRFFQPNSRIVYISSVRPRFRGAII
ncbi:hypothetical protein PENDEC_c010G05580 [Penicillium decumbens]|uniref:Uncharacterized protein n=1 Tax=Penicillium decumbens TaxID=69771 RepID=A0A1V6PDD0_PENDC|nr:hypothetical protein PENDEC_c010G05580 [Penicillium decumbens]